MVVDLCIMNHPCTPRINLIMAYSIFNVLLNLIYKYFIKNILASMVIREIVLWFLLLFCPYPVLVSG
jgi:hypothetical protein